MAVNYFDVDRGFSIDEGAIVIFKGTSNSTDLNGVLSADVPIGSLFLNTVTGEVLSRTAAVNDDVTDWVISADQDYVDTQLATQISWREPVVICDETTYANIAAAESAMNAASPPGLDGVALNENDRVLFTSLTAGNENVYIVTGTPGAGATLVEDVNTATNGDTVYVQSGTCAGQRHTYNGTAWVLTDQSSVDELDYIRQFIGKDTIGLETPSYTNNYNITANNDLEGAIDELDTILGSNLYTNDFVVTDSASYTANIDALDTQFGPGAITNPGGNWSLSDDLLWGTGGSPVLAGTLDITDAFNEINDVIGDRTYTADNYVTDGESIAASIDALDQAIGSVAILQFTGNNVAAAGLAVDSTLAHGGTPTEVKWFILVRDTATPANVEALEVHALTDGTLSDFTVYAKLKTGTKVAGLSVDVVVNGANYELQLTASNNIDYVVERGHTLSF